MKKISTILFAGMMVVSFVSCGGGKSEDKSPEGQVQTEEKAQPVAQTADTEKSLADYEAYVTKYTEVIKKMKAGDTGVIQEYSQLSSQMQQLNADMARFQIDFSADQLKRWEAAQAKLAEAVKSLNEKK